MAETFCRAHVEDHAGRVLCCEKLAGHGKIHRFGDDHWMESAAFYPPNEAPATEAHRARPGEPPAALHVAEIERLEAKRGTH